MKKNLIHGYKLNFTNKIKVDVKKDINIILESGNLASGNFVKSFEKKLEEFTNSNVICCNSGTSALHISLISAGVKVGDEVIAPSITFIATINAILYCGASPIFMDCDESLCVDTNKLLEFLKNNTYSVKKIHIIKKQKKKYQLL